MSASTSTICKILTILHDLQVQLERLHIRKLMNPYLGLDIQHLRVRGSCWCVGCSYSRSRLIFHHLFLSRLPLESFLTSSSFSPCLLPILASYRLHFHILTLSFGRCLGPPLSLFEIFLIVNSIRPQFNPSQTLHLLIGRSATMGKTFAGVKLCHTDDFPSPQNEGIKRWVENNGGIFQRQISADTTHLICSQNSWKRNSHLLRMSRVLPGR
jgi:hypothetical protein